MLGIIDTFWDVVRLLGGIAIVGSFVVSASVWLTKKLIEKGFAKELETHKADLQRVNAAEVERLKVELSTDLGRRTRLLEREFVALPEIWDRVHNAVSATQAVASRFRPGANVYGINAAALEEVLAFLDVPEHAKDEVRREQNMNRRQDLFTKLENVSKLNHAYKTVHDARNYLIGHSIFLDQETGASIRNLLDLARRAVDQAVHNHQYPPEPGQRMDLTDTDAFMADAGGLLLAAEVKVRERLGAHQPGTQNLVAVAAVS
ncbi:hypothetical protein [Caulobacter sp. FWC2]|uniref:hypothetical protein n=1 Tax=Caulobacter sp. FWC2 TaxID=69664 RepID=UPI000C15D8EA|nr:hypothetical protein [Caulobacter sp. FWC2]PIB91506.1 hypothetical protein CSW62_07910 [Caulobacter sp. FWC2]